MLLNFAHVYKANSSSSIIFMAFLWHGRTRSHLRLSTYSSHADVFVMNIASFVIYQILYWAIYMRETISRKIGYYIVLTYSVFVSLRGISVLGDSGLVPSILFIAFNEFVLFNFPRLLEWSCRWAIQYLGCIICGKLTCGGFQVGSPQGTVRVRPEGFICHWRVLRPFPMSTAVSILASEAIEKHSLCRLMVHDVWSCCV